MFRYILIFSLTALLAACGSHKGSDTLKGLSDGVVDGLASGNMEQVVGYLLDGNVFVSVCEERFQTDSVEDFKRRLNNNRRRLRSRLSQCATKLGDQLEVVELTGGRKMSAVKGCGGHVWEHTDVKLKVRSDGRMVDVLLVGVVGMEGRYYILDQIYCR